MVEDWVRRIVEEVSGGSPVEVGKYYTHPKHGLIRIVSGQYWGRDGISNHWRWEVVETGEIKHGYGDDWPLAEAPKEKT